MPDAILAAGSGRLPRAGALSVAFRLCLAAHLRGPAASARSRAGCRAMAAGRKG